MVDQEYVVLISRDYPLDAVPLKDTLCGILNEQVDNKLEVYFNNAYTLNVFYEDQLTLGMIEKCIEDRKKQPLSRVARKSHDESGLLMTAWSRRGPGWYRDRWLTSKIEEVALGLEQPTSQDDEMMALHRRITSDGKLLAEKVAEIESLVDLNTEAETALVEKDEEIESLKGQVRERDDIVEDREQQIVDLNERLLNKVFEPAPEQIQDLEEAITKQRRVIDQQLMDLQCLREENEELQSKTKRKVNVSMKNGSYTSKLEQQLELLGGEAIIPLLKRVSEGSNV